MASDGHLGMFPEQRPLTAAKQHHGPTLECDRDAKSVLLTVKSQLHMGISVHQNDKSGTKFRVC
jgi:hypothetical protein